MSQTEKVALITGITGQDGSYLAELLLEKNCKKFCLCVTPCLRMENVFWDLGVLLFWNDWNFEIDI